MKNNTIAAARGKDGKLANRFGSDRGDLVQTIIIIAGFAVAAIVAIGMISSTLMAKGEGVAECIAGSTNFSSTSASGFDNCQTANETATENAETGINANKPGGSTPEEG